MDAAEFPTVKITPLRTWAEWPLQLVQGDGWSMKVRFKLPEGGAIDKTGYEYQATVRARTGDSVGYPISVTLTDLPNGEIDLALTSEQTRQMRREMVWDLQEIAPGGQPQTRLRGGVLVEREITL